MKNIITSIAIFLAGFGFSQQGDGGYVSTNMDLNNIPNITLPSPNVAELREEDERNALNKVGPWRFGFNNEVNYSLSNAGEWNMLPNGDYVWHLKVECEGALTVNLTFENTEIPEGNELFVYNEDESFVLGSFTQKHIYKGSLGTELIPGSVAIIEYRVPSENVNEDNRLTLSRITHGYRTAKEFTEKTFGSSGNCNMNVACPDGANYQEIIRSAVMLVSGSNGFCSGAMINNTANDQTPYVLTANHCYGSNVANWIFRFNWQSDNCSDPNSSPSFVSLSGATLRARDSESDFCLVEITGGLENGAVPLSYGTYLAGWNNQDVAPTSTIGVHHPSGDIKKISFDDDPAVSANGMSSPIDDTQWEVQWDRNTTTEGGSSGSPLFDQDGRIIGQLWGGGASCFNLSSPDFYGKLSYSWDPPASNNAKELKHWLDPTNSGATSLDGFDPFASIAENQTVDFTIYPNPSNGTFNIAFDSTVEGDIFIVDVYGKSVAFTQESNGSTTTVQLNSFASGVYFVKVGSSVERIVVD